MSYRYPAIEQVVTIKGAHLTEGGISEIRTTNPEQAEITAEALLEMKIMNLHLSIITDNDLKRTDLEEV